MAADIGSMDGRSSRRDAGTIQEFTLSTADNAGPRLNSAKSDELVFDTHELGRRPGASQSVQRVVAAPAGLTIDVIGVPEGSDLRVDVRLEAVMEGVLASGSARLRLVGECVRCLDAIERELEVTFQELYVYPNSDAEEDEASRLEGDLLDLEPVIRDTAVLALPFRPVCRDDCPGLCVECGQRLADDPDHRHEAPTDPRWAALADWQPDDQRSDDNDETTNT